MNNKKIFLQIENQILLNRKIFKKEKSTLSDQKYRHFTQNKLLVWKDMFQLFIISTLNND